MISSAILIGAVSASLGSLVLDVTARVWRKDDVALWHVLWVALGVSSTVLACPGLQLPHVTFTAPMGSLAPPSTVALVWTVVGWVYAIGFAWHGARLVVGWLVITRLARQASTLNDAWAAGVYETAPDAAPLCRVHRRVQVPVTVGWHRPVILLPEACAAWPMDRLLAILRHEHAHVRRGDYLWNFIGALHQVVYWFSPCAWLLGRRVRLFAELASDRAVSDAIGPAPYAKHLVDAANEWADAGAMGILAPGATSNLVQRMQALASPESARRPVGRAWRGTLAAVVVILVTIGVATRFESPRTAGSGSGNLLHAAFPHMGSGDAHALKHAAGHPPTSR